MIPNYLLATATGLLLLFTSCKKDVIQQEQSLTATTVDNATAADAQIETAPATYTSVVTNVNSNVAGFWQGVPALYSQTTKKYPLIIFIHGIGELGTSLSRLNCCGLPSHLKNKKFPANFSVNGSNYSFIVMAPQFKVRPSAADVQSVIDYAKNRFRIDASRIYVSGLSMGGGSTWDWAAVYGQNAAAIVPVCGGTAPTTNLAKSVSTKNLPIWAIYSYKDEVVPASWGTNWINWIDGYNAAYASKTKLTIYSDVNHNSTWSRAFNPSSKVDGYSIYEWMLLYTRSGATSTTPTAPAPTTPTTPTTPTPTNPSSGNIPPVAKAGDDQTIPVSWKYLRLNGLFSTDADGWITSVRWTQISGPSTIVLTTPNSGNTLTSGMVAGTYVFRVAVTDNKGAVSYDECKVTFTGTGTTTTTSTPSPTNPSSGNIPPVARAGDDQTIPVSWKYLRLNGLFSTDADGWITSVRWTQISGPSTIVLTTPNSGNTLTSGMVAGTYTFRVAVTDNKGAVSYDDCKVTFTK